MNKINTFGLIVTFSFGIFALVAAMVGPWLQSFTTEYASVLAQVGIGLMLATYVMFRFGE